MSTRQELMAAISKLADDREKILDRISSAESIEEADCYHIGVGSNRVVDIDYPAIVEVKRAILSELRNDLVRLDNRVSDIAQDLAARKPEGDDANG